MPSISDGGACIIKLSLPSLSASGLVAGGFAAVGAVAEDPAPPVIAEFPVSTGLVVSVLVPVVVI